MAKVPPKALGSKAGPKRKKSPNGVRKPQPQLEAERFARRPPPLPKRETEIKTVLGGGAKPVPVNSTIDYELLKNLISLQCSAVELCSFFGIPFEDLMAKVHKETGVPWSTFYSMYSATGRVSLRRAQFLKAMEGDTLMLMHLGKHWLHQWEVRLVAPAIGPDGKPILEAPDAKQASNIAFPVRVRIIDAEEPLEVSQPSAEAPDTSAGPVRDPGVPEVPQ